MCVYYCGLINRWPVGLLKGLYCTTKISHLLCTSYNYSLSQQGRHTAQTLKPLSAQFTNTECIFGSLLDEKMARKKPNGFCTHKEWLHLTFCKKYKRHNNDSIIQVPHFSCCNKIGEFPEIVVTLYCSWHLVY